MICLRRFPKTLGIFTTFSSIPYILIKILFIHACNPFYWTDRVAHITSLIAAVTIATKTTRWKQYTLIHIRIQYICICTRNYTTEAHTRIKTKSIVIPNNTYYLLTSTKIQHSVGRAANYPATQCYQAHIIYIRFTVQHIQSVFATSNDRRWF